MQPIVFYIIAGCLAASLLTLQALSLASLRRMKRLVKEKPEKKEQPETTKSVFADILEFEDIDLQFSHTLRAVRDAKDSQIDALKETISDLREQLSIYDVKPYLGDHEENDKEDEPGYRIISSEEFIKKYEEEQRQAAAEEEPSLKSTEETQPQDTGNDLFDFEEPVEDTPSITALRSEIEWLKNETTAKDDSLARLGKSLEKATAEKKELVKNYEERLEGKDKRIKELIENFEEFKKEAKKTANDYRALGMEKHNLELKNEELQQYLKDAEKAEERERKAKETAQNDLRTLVESREKNLKDTQKSVKELEALQKTITEKDSEIARLKDLSVGDSDITVRELLEKNERIQELEEQVRSLGGEKGAPKPQEVEPSLFPEPEEPETTQEETFENPGRAVALDGFKNDMLRQGITEAQYNAVTRLGIATLGDLLKWTEKSLGDMPGVTGGVVDTLRGILGRYGLRFGMDAADQEALMASGRVGPARRALPTDRSVAENDALNTPVADLQLGAVYKAALRKAGIATAGDLVVRSRHDLVTIPGLNAQCLDKTQEALKRLGLDFDMDTAQIRKFAYAAEKEKQRARLNNKRSKKEE